MSENPNLTIFILGQIWRLVRAKGQPQSNPIPRPSNRSPPTQRVRPQLNFLNVGLQLFFLGTKQYPEPSCLIFRFRLDLLDHLL